MISRVLLNELRIYKEVSRKRYGVFYYGTPGAGEIDFLIETRLVVQFTPPPLSRLT